MQDIVLNLLGWMAEDESKKKSDRVKIAFKNHKGKKWGRKSIPETTKDKIIKMYKEGNSLRKIVKDIYYYDKNNHPKNVSLGIVHKTIDEFKGKKTTQK